MERGRWGMHGENRSDDRRARPTVEDTVDARKLRSQRLRKLPRLALVEAYANARNVDATDIGEANKEP